MKKLYTLFLTALLAAPALAQMESETYQFVDANGDVVPDGSEITCNTVEEDPFGDGFLVGVPLAAKNTSDYDAEGSMSIRILSMDNGYFQSCAFGNCQRYDVGVQQRPVSLVASGDTHPLRTEWVASAYGQCTAELTLQEVDLGEYIEGPTIKVHFIYADPAAVSAVEMSHGPVVARYTLSGQQLSRPAKGINVVRYADGATRKVAVK